MGTRHPRLATAILALIAWTAMPTPANASCVVVGSVEAMVADSGAAFVGVVEAVTNQDRWATVRVEEVWHGPITSATVEVRGGPEPGAGSSADRTYRAGVRYLFTVSVRDGTLVDSICSMTTDWRAELLEMRPPTARAVDAAMTVGPSDPAGISRWILPALAVIVVGVAIFGAVFVARLKR
jgi:hypothetical protein